MTKALIFTGGDGDLERIRHSAEVTTETYPIVIAADCGMAKSLALGIRPTLLVGDFDSMAIPASYADLPVFRMPAHKDETDTMTAARKAIELGAREILFIGGTGGRLDHGLSNVFLLEAILEAGARATFYDGRNRLTVLRDETAEIPRRGFRYFSLLTPDEATVTIQGAVYPLDRAPLHRRMPYAVSNEILPEADRATVTVDGTVFLIESDPVTA